ncbi:hypothetical protein ACOBQB_23350 [Streptomyces sp. G5(2025)]|uniref:hypothetical protein n=1 Tax=Streptomyces sp. G5(2025) TaxID=3406628 RepID=UPI003C19B638
MRICSLAPRAAGVAGVAVLVMVALPGGGAAAHENGSVDATVTPADAAAGASVEVRVTGCEGATGSAGSGAFEGEARLAGRGGDDLHGTARIRKGVTGSYELTVICDGHPHQGVGTVRVAQRNTEPTAPVRAGGGGTAHLTSAVSAEPDGADEAGPGTRHAVIGLILAGVAAVAVAFRSVRRRRSE